jgi:hypothetical protein
VKRTLLCLLGLTGTAVAQESLPNPPSAPNSPNASDEVSVENAQDLAAEPAKAVDISAPPAQGSSVIVGVVRDGGDGSPVAGAEVSIPGLKMLVTTDSEGRFRLDVPPGNTYVVRIFADFYKPVQVRNVRAAYGRIARLDPKLTPDAGAIEEAVAVEAEVERASMSTQLLLRRKDASASDGVSAQEIAKSTDRNAADALKRVVGASIVDGKYVVVRGLGDRYMSTRLNGSPIPSPEPDHQAVPLDIFPTLVLSDLTVRKTFTPDLPGDFTGGLVEIHTRDIPSKFMFSANANLGLNTQTTFQSRLGYPGGATDFLGVDDGGRSIPREIPAEKLVEIDPNTGERKDLSSYARALVQAQEWNVAAFHHRLRWLSRRRFLQQAFPSEAGRDHPRLHLGRHARAQLDSSDRLSRSHRKRQRELERAWRTGRHLQRAQPCLPDWASHPRG